MANEYYPDQKPSEKYLPRFLSTAQVDTESGGNQFGSDGKPLRSPKGATGVAQVMPATGPEAAKLAGLPWDQKRFETDRDYNMKLGDAYQRHLNKIFNGHQLAATAAYNAGPTRVLKLRQKYGDNWAAYLPDETKKYVKGILGVDVGGRPGTAAGTKSFGEDILSKLGLSHGPYEVGQPGPNETKTESGNFPIATPGDPAAAPAIKQGIADVQSSTGRYATFLQSAIQPLHDNSVAIADKAKGIASTKESLYTDFAAREKALEEKIVPLQERRQALVDRLADLDAMSPLERRLKSAFNSDYDSRVLRGRLERVEMQLSGHQKTYDELNKIRSGVAALSVDADSADVDAISAQSRTVLADAQLFGQVATAVSTNLDATLLPGKVAAEQIKLEQVAKAKLLGGLTVERSTQLFNQASSSPDGAVTIDGVKLTVGELQTQAREGQAQDIRFKSLKNAYAVEDIQTAQNLEGDFIDHMTPEQINQAMAAGGVYQGQQLSITKLTAAAASREAMRASNVQQAVTSTAPGLVADMLDGIGAFAKQTSTRATEIFGNTPGEMTSALNVANSQIVNFQHGLEAAKARGVGPEFIASQADTINSIRKTLDTTVTTVANKWAGGKPELQAVAENYLRGNPLSGDAAIKGLIVMARGSGIPNNAKLSGPALQAYQIAQATVKDWDSPNPVGGESLDAIMQAGKTKKDSDLMRIVQTRISSVYANALTDTIMTSLPNIARQIHDPSDPKRPHPFAAVNRDDFIAAIQHGDHEGYSKAATDLGISIEQAKQMANGGVENNPVWEQVKKAKGWTDGNYPSVLAEINSAQINGTLAALDASHSARPGFSPAKAFIQLLNDPNLQNKLQDTVNGYGRSGFGAFVVSSAAGGGFSDAFANYGQQVQAVYTAQHGNVLRDRIKQQRSLMADPFVRMKAVLRAADIPENDANQLINAVRPIAHVNNASPSELLGMRNPAMTDAITTGNFDSIASIIRNHQFENKQIEAIRRRASTNWQEMDNMVSRIGESMNE